MSLHLYNSLTRVTEPFEPEDRHRVGMYVCGPTVYDRAHVGNARPVVVFDVLFRLLQRRFGEEHVTYVRNITDVDDKIIAAASERSEEIGELTRRTTALYHQDMAALNCLPPTVEPRATAYIAQMIGMIETLIGTGAAYEAEGHVLFAVSAAPEYGRLSGRNRDEQIAGARVDVAPYKKDPADFVLWKPSIADMPGWESPWGRGRPGWHIECSAMAGSLLGERFDIHGGGIDLIFPHHENEIAQSRCAHGGEVMARVWMHNGHVVVGGQKMAKSLGNFTTVEQLLARWPGEVVRLALMSAHYRQPLDINEDLLASSKRRLDYIYGVLRRNPSDTGEVARGVEEALKSDLNTPSALSYTEALAASVESGEAKASDLRGSLAGLGLYSMDEVEWARWQPPAGRQYGISETTIDILIESRREARASRDFAEADRIRKELADNGVELEDKPDGTFWRRSR